MSTAQAGDTKAPADAAGRQPVFATTHWSVVLRAGQADTTRAQDALSRLCTTYWYPLYAYVRRRGHSAHDAQDLTQAFFAQLLERQSFVHADPNRGRFRSFLLTVMNHFLVNEWTRAHAQKRGGGASLLPLQFETAETRFVREPADNTTPEQIYERRWAMALLAEVVRRLADEYKEDGRAELFAELNPCLVGERAAQPYAELAAKLGVSENTVKSSVHRMRQRYRQLLRDEIANTVEEPSEVDEELRHLFHILSTTAGA
ncbi:MAG TPA: sigma-70 family RNA polymerase sigma factor [Verrucomicrobiae bacterium]|nr:sigma-70 family RNA polymerase sigma factor [Verrucomicrobiae bacterium]